MTDDGPIRLEPGLEIKRAVVALLNLKRKITAAAREGRVSIRDEEEEKKRRAELINYMVKDTRIRFEVKGNGTITLVEYEDPPSMSDSVKKIDSCTGGLTLAYHLEKRD